MKNKNNTYYDLGSKSDNKVISTVLLFDEPNNPNNLNGRGKILYDITDFNKQHLLDIIKDILVKNNTNVNDHNINLFYDFVKKMCFDNIPKSKYFKDELCEILNELI